MNKIPQITLAFWITKICATTLGETAGDMLSMTFNLGYGTGSLVYISIFIIALIFQLSSKCYNPFIYWLVILATSTAGTTMSDYMDRTLGLGYALGSFILIVILLSMLALWRYSAGTLSVSHINTRKEELFYWFTILFSNTLGTAFGDFLADDSGLGFAGGAILIAAVLGLLIVAYYKTNISRILLFWQAFILTRPFGATFGDVLTKTVDKGGLDLGTIGSSTVLFSILVVCIVANQKKLNISVITS